MPRIARKSLRQRGSILIFCLLAIPIMIIPLVGLAIDVTMLRIVQARLSASVDAAALGAGRLLGTSAAPVAMATEFVKANFQADGTQGFWGASNLQINATYTPGITKTIWVNATADVPLLFLRIFGQQKATISAAGTATRTDSRVMLVIDRSGSMNVTALADGNMPITDAVNDAIEFTQHFTAGADEVGLIVFDASATVAYPAYAPGTYSATPTAAHGPDTGFNTFTAPATMGPMITMLTNTQAHNGSTNTSEALWLAYVELQKAHLRDIAGGATDTRLNAIVLMTDGLPQAVTVYPNNVTGYPGKYFMSPPPGNKCTNLYNAVSMPNPPPIIGAATVPYNGTHGGNMFSGMLPDVMLSQLASTDNLNPASWWVGQGAGKMLALESGNDGGCTHLFGTGGSGGIDFSKIPSFDAYGNTMSGLAFNNSVFVDGTGNAVTPSNNPIQGLGTSLNQANVYSGIDWVQAQWNAADSSAQRIRTDVNLVNRPGDVKMPIYIYAIGFLGDGGCDQGLLQRIANDPLSSSYDINSPPGKYYPASDSVALHNAFETVVATILRLAR